MSRSPSIATIVEGKGEQHAVPGLVRRILAQYERYDLQVPPSKVTNTKSNLLNKFEKFLRYALIDGCAAILVLLDADDECPRTEVVDLVRKVTALNLDVPVAIVYAKCEYETWFICSLSSDQGDKIRERLELPAHVTAPENAEKIRNAKGWLTERMPRHRSYKEISDQAPLTHHIELDLVRSRSRSFRRLCHAIEELLQAVDLGEATVTPLLD